MIEEKWLILFKTTDSALLIVSSLSEAATNYSLKYNKDDLL